MSPSPIKPTETPSNSAALDLVLVGNGPSAAGWLAGRLVDSARDVARCNNYVIHGFERCVGRKTTIWVRNDTQGVQDREDAPPTVLWVARPDRPQPGRLTPHRLSETQWASTGVTAALHFLSQGRRVALHGFDFFAARRHHYFRSNSGNKHHSPIFEQQLLAPYFESGQLTVLQPNMSQAASANS